MLLIRHAESEWNRLFGPTRIDPGIADPPITAEGAAAARLAAAELRGQGIGRLLTSPYRRALETAAIIAEALDVPVSVEPLVRERCAYSCDEGSHPALLAERWPHLDFSLLGDLWWGEGMESVDSLGVRARSFLDTVRDWPDRDEVAVVSHWGFIRCLTGQEVANLGRVRLAFHEAGETAGAEQQKDIR
jgi:broad specificity phosphatase PhoE